MSNPGNVAGGHKATINNPSKLDLTLNPTGVSHSSLPRLDVSDEAKQHSKEVLDNEFQGGAVGGDDNTEKNPNRVAGGLKAYVNSS